MLGLFPNMPGYALREDFTRLSLLIQACNEDNGSLGGVDYIQNSYFGRVPGQQVPAGWTPLARDQPGFHDLVKNLFKVPQGYFLTFGDVFNLGGLPVPMIGNIKHSTNAISTCCDNTHS